MKSPQRLPSHSSPPGDDDDAEDEVELDPVTQIDAKNPNSEEGSQDESDPATHEQPSSVPQFEQGIKKSSH